MQQLNEFVPGGPSQDRRAAEGCHVCGIKTEVVEVYRYTFLCCRCRSDRTLTDSVIRWNRYLDEHGPRNAS
jgi:hypothetical protein